MLAGHTVQALAITGLGVGLGTALGGTSLGAFASGIAGSTAGQAIGLGISAGFTGYSGYNTYQNIRDGDIINGIDNAFSTGLGIFSLAQSAKNLKWCFPAGTLIATENGSERSIESDR